MPAGGADTCGVRRPGAARSASGRRDQAPLLPTKRMDPGLALLHRAPRLPPGSSSQGLTSVPSSCATEAGSE